MKRKTGRTAEPRIVDPATHPRSSVCLTVAAEWLQIDERTVLARIEDGLLRGWKDGKAYRIDILDLVSYDQRRRHAS